MLTLIAAALLAVDLDPAAATRFARLALDCVHREYPNKIAHVLNADSDVAPPRRLTPAFYGCYDWHSSVHGHWMLARLARTFPESAIAAEARRALGRSLTAENLNAEAAYLEGPGRGSFERPYGLAWLLQLAAELREWKTAEAREWSRRLMPLERAAVARLSAWLPKITHPVRSGEHSQSAFALGLMLDWARESGDRAFESLVRAKTLQFYGRDRACPIGYEPSGEDFVSPCLAEADVMRRALPPPEFARWLTAFLPQVRLAPAMSPDRSDGKLAHLDGLNLSRAWMIEGIVTRLPKADARRPALQRLASAHRDAGLAAVTGEHYEGGHWLASFAVYLLSRRGIATHEGTSNPPAPAP